jgi:hypothetical protein
MTFREMNRRVPMPQAMMDRWQLVPNTLDREHDTSRAYSISPLAQAWLPVLGGRLQHAATLLPGEGAPNRPPPTNPSPPSLSGGINAQ